MRRIEIEYKGMFAVGEFDELISNDDAKKLLMEDIEREIPRDYPVFEYKCRSCSCKQRQFIRKVGTGGFLGRIVDVFVCPCCRNETDFDMYLDEKERYEEILNIRQTNGFFEKTKYISPRAL